MQEYRDQPGTVGEILIPFCICSRAQSTAIVAFMESSYAFNEYGLRSQWSLGKSGCAFLYRVLLCLLPCRP